MKNAEAETLLACHCAGLPGTEDPRITKAVRLAEKDPALQQRLARQRAFDHRNLAAVEQLVLPQAFLARLDAGQPESARPLSGKAALTQPVLLACGIAALTLLGWGGLTLWNRAHSFPGKDSMVRMVEVNDEMTGMEMEPKKDPSGALNDWFFDKYGFEDYFLPAGFENYQTIGARLFKQDGEPVAQVAVEENNMIFFSFKAEDFGVALPNDEWHIFTDAQWVAAVQQHDEECFMVCFRGSRGDMEALLKGKAGKL
ncbi:MAG TPA: hypothetical protein VHY22_13785 [Chthoniobacteraceae bacterium]|nr:hypothetical protein [Chthoniobacteraceae bacterium]